MGYYWTVKLRLGGKHIKTVRFGGAKWGLRSKKDIKSWARALARHQKGKVEVLSIKKTIVKKKKHKKKRR